MYGYDGTTSNILTSLCCRTIAAFQSFTATFFEAVNRKPLFSWRPRSSRCLELNHVCAVIELDEYVLYIPVLGERARRGRKKAKRGQVMRSFAWRRDGEACGKCGICGTLPQLKSCIREQPERLFPNHCNETIYRIGLDRRPRSSQLCVRGSGCSSSWRGFGEGAMRRINYPMREREWSCAQWSAHSLSSFPYSLLTETPEGGIRRLKRTQLDDITFTRTRLWGSPTGFLCSVPCHLQSLLAPATPLSRAILGLHLGFFKLWIIHTKQSHILGLKYHDKYGPVVRAAPNLLAVNDPKLLPTMDHRRVDKSDVYTMGVLKKIAPSFQTLKHEEHAAKRKRVASSVWKRGCDAAQTTWLMRPAVYTKLPEAFGKSSRWVYHRTHECVEKKICRCERENGFHCLISVCVVWLSLISNGVLGQNQCLTKILPRWFAYDMICQLSIGEPVGFIKEARDVENLIGDFDKMAPFVAVVGSLPWIIRPIMENPIGRWLFIPRPGDGTGTGRIMAVSIFLIALCL